MLPTDCMEIKFEPQMACGTHCLGQFPNLTGSPFPVLNRAQTGVSYTGHESHTGVEYQVPMGKRETPEPDSCRLIDIPVSRAALLVFQRLEPFAKLSNECHAIWKLF